MISYLPILIYIIGEEIYGEMCLVKGHKMKVEEQTKSGLHKGFTREFRH